MASTCKNENLIVKTEIIDFQYTRTVVNKNCLPLILNLYVFRDHEYSFDVQIR